ncbi:MAG TPA: N-acetyltransferase [Tepidisphaeraceae bacterium]|nr:N-acetyltransferase [Tepidisphaeraceae bacterium]
MTVRPAKITDVPRIHEIINQHAELGRMLFKSYAQLYEDLRDFAVCEIEVDGKLVVAGCVAVGVIWADLAEVRSLAVDETLRGKGMGTQLVRWCIEDARRVGIRKLMSLTYERNFFEKLGFVVVDKDTLPLKVWSDCVRCPKNQNCDEIAMVLELTDVPHIEAPLAVPTPRGVSIPVLPAGYED